MTTNFEDLPLPYGWSKEFDITSGHYFYVDTKAVPPRAIWVHPYQDPQYLSEHPDVKEKVAPNTKTEAVYDYGQEKELPPPAYSPGDSDPIADSKAKDACETSSVQEAISIDPKGKKKQGFLDRVFGKDEDDHERKQAKKQAKRVAEAAKEEQKRQIAIAKQAQRRAQEEYERSHHAQFAQYHNYPGAAHYTNMPPNMYAPPPPPGMMYGPPPNMYHPPPVPPPPMGYGPGYPHPGPYGSNMSRPSGSGSGSMALPIVGGLAGGLLLGSLLEF